MSWTDDEIAEMARAGHAEQKFAYHDAYFTEVEGLLAKKRKRYFPFIVFPLLPLLGIFSYLTFFDKAFIEPTSVAKTNQVYSVMEYVTDQYASAGVQTNYASLEPTDVLSSYDLNASEEKQIARENKMYAPARRKATNTKEPVVKTDKKEKLIERLKKSTDVQMDLPLAVKPQHQAILMEHVVRLEHLPILELSGSNVNHINALPAYQKTVRWNIYLEAGAGMGQSYLNTQLGHTKSLNLGAGYRYDKRNTFLQFGLTGELQKVQLEISERSKIYHTSLTEYENVFNYQNLYRLQTPLTIGYKLKQHSLQVSLIPSYLMGAKMNYAYKENGQTMQSMTTYTERRGWNNFSSSLGFGYGYQLPYQVTLGANVNWQLLNQINRNQVNNGANRPFSGQVFIRKMLK